MRIGITQRVEVVASYGERRDCLDQAWTVLLGRLSLVPVPVPNSLERIDDWLLANDLDGFVLTGGNDIASLPGARNTAPERDRTETAILDHAAARAKPVLAVCRGFQMLVLHEHGQLAPVEGHTAVRHPVRPVADEPLFQAFAEVNSFHDWGVVSVGDRGLVATAFCDDGTIEAVRHRQHPWIGTMWHPEREQPFAEADLTLIHTLFRGPS
ncbi:gamma-glutamyl-gamma-aminobutyrate hydrolase family protein [Marinobacter sp. JSM 1782161]|uniref:gamma-glutamyl-gamma-aminobutyrate hydrolase family protein n=1 Tax=Marinobacter sp. JSM 1782161 TaxID=2685906 RepID=UPI0014024C9B|nr:gamma-glutamyl-gamma-aminobutyrate hydrolase family protein [Marinobacter sp. JSM 1782161]